MSVARGEFFTIDGRDFEFGRTVADARRLLCKATERFVVVCTRIDLGSGYGRSSASLFFERHMFLGSISHMEDGDALVTHLQSGDDGSVLFVGNILAVKAAAKTQAAGAAA